MPPEDGGILYASRICSADGSMEWGHLSKTLDDFQDIREFPNIYQIWPGPDYNYGTMSKRFRIYTSSIHHAVSLP
jgi:hypothetical protein